MQYFILTMIVLLAAIGIGFLLPKERIVQKKSIYKISRKELFEIVTNNNDFSYRSDLKDLVIIETIGDIQKWKETGKRLFLKQQRRPHIPIMNSK